MRDSHGMKKQLRVQKFGKQIFYDGRNVYNDGRFDDCPGSISYRYLQLTLFFKKK